MGEIEIIEGDCRQVMAGMEAGSVDAIVTDPPYPREFLEMYASVWESCDRILSPDGLVFVMAGQLDLPRVYASFPASWQYLWTGCFLLQATRVPIWPMGISTGWKPLIIYGKSKTKFKPWTYDVLSPATKASDDKKHHEWGQDSYLFTQLIDRFDIQGTILDPFVGGGTTLVACMKTGRRGIGIESDGGRIPIARRRVRDAATPLFDAPA